MCLWVVGQAEDGWGMYSFRMDTMRVQRLLRLILQLQSGPPRPIDELARFLGVSRRTVYRDLRVLEAAGVPYESHRGRGYTLAKSFFMPPLSLTVPEALGLMLLSRSAAAQRDRPMVGPALSAIYKLMAMVPEPIRSACSEMMAHVSVESTPAVSGDHEAAVYGPLQRAADAGVVVDLVYRSPVESGMVRTRLHPYLLHFAARAWYVLGHSEHHREVRVFKLQRVEAVEPTADRFERPADFTLATKLGHAWQLNPGNRDYEIELVFDARVATNVIETRWHDTQRHKRMSDGRARVWFTVSGLDEIAWWLCGYADQVRIVKPVALRRLVGQMLQRGADRHQQSGA